MEQTLPQKKATKNENPSNLSASRSTLVVNNTNVSKVFEKSSITSFICQSCENGDIDAVKLIVDCITELNGENETNHTSIKGLLF